MTKEDKEKGQKVSITIPRFPRERLPGERPDLTTGLWPGDNLRDQVHIGVPDAGKVCGVSSRVRPDSTGTNWFDVQVSVDLSLFSPRHIPEIAMQLEKVFRKMLEKYYGTTVGEVLRQQVEERSRERG